MELSLVDVLFAGRSIEFLFVSRLDGKKISAEFVFETAWGDSASAGANSNDASTADVRRALRQ